MSKDVASYIISGFNDHSRVDAHLLLTALFYAEKSVGLPATGASEELLRELEEEEFAEETSQFLKECVVRFAAQTQSIDLFVSAVRVLQPFNDPKLHTLLTGWLDAHLRKLLSHSGAVSQLLHVLERTGAPVPHRSSSGITMVESNIDTARKYLHQVLGVRYPW